MKLAPVPQDQVIHDEFRMTRIAARAYSSFTAARALRPFTIGAFVAASRSRLPLFALAAMTR